MFCFKDFDPTSWSKQDNYFTDEAAEVFLKLLQKAEHLSMTEALTEEWAQMESGEMTRKSMRWTWNLNLERFGTMDFWRASVLRQFTIHSNYISEIKLQQIDLREAKIFDFYFYIRQVSWKMADFADAVLVAWETRFMRTHARELQKKKRENKRQRTEMRKWPDSSLA